MNCSKCAKCEHLIVISVPDWFQCKKYGHEGPTQTDLSRKCLKDNCTSLNAKSKKK